MSASSHTLSRRSRLRTASLAVGIAALCWALPSAPAAARPHPSSVVRWLDFPQIHVANDGSRYTGVTGLAYGWRADLRLDSDSNTYGVAEWSLKLVPSVEGVGDLDLDTYAASGSYRAGSRPRTVAEVVGATFPNSAVRNWAVGVCGHRADILRGRGWSDRRILGREHVIAVRVQAVLDWGTTNVGALHSIHGPFFSEVVCEAHEFPPPPGADGLQADTEFKLLLADLTITPDRHVGRCPNDLRLDLEVRANHKGPFRARIESTEGWRSHEITGQTGEAVPGTGFWRKRMRETLTVPYEVPAPQGAAPSPFIGSGDMLNPTEGGGPDEKPDPGGPQQGAPVALADPTPDDVHRAALRLVAVAGDQRVYSRWRDFFVRCKPQPTVDGPSDMVPAPDPVVDPPSSPSMDSPSSDAGEDEGRPSESARPDLRILRAGSRDGVLGVTVRNHGGAPAPATRLLIVCEAARGAIHWRAEVPALAAGAERSLQTRPPADPATSRSAVPDGCRLEVDPDGRVVESDERNNVFLCERCSVEGGGRGSRRRERPSPGRRRAGLSAPAASGS